MFLVHPLTSYKFEAEGTCDNDVCFFSKFRERKYHQRTLVIWCEMPCCLVDGLAYCRNLLLPSSVWTWKMEAICCPETSKKFLQTCTASHHKRKCPSQSRRKWNPAKLPLSVADCYRAFCGKQLRKTRTAVSWQCLERGVLICNNCLITCIRFRCVTVKADC